MPSRSSARNKDQSNRHRAAGPSSCADRMAAVIELFDRCVDGLACGASSSIGRECGGQEKRVLQDSVPKRLKTLGHSPKLPEGTLHDLRSTAALSASPRNECRSTSSGERGQGACVQLGGGDDGEAEASSRLAMASIGRSIIAPCKFLKLPRSATTSIVSTPRTSRAEFRYHAGLNA
jgi:hypothetical protein